MADAAMPESGQTIVCADNLDNEGVVNREADDVTVEIQGPAGGISVTGQPGVALGDGATVTVSGESNRPINTSGDSAPGIEVGSGAAITVDGQVTTSGGMSDAINTGDMGTVEVSGTVRTGGGMSDAISVGADSTVDILGGARVETGNSESNAVTLRGTGSTVNVEADAVVTTSSGMSNPIWVQGDMGTVDVSGEVRSSSGDATAILLEGDQARVTVGDGGFVTAQSSGSNGIESTGEGATIRVEQGGEVRISSGNSAAIVAGPMGTVELAGTVGASSSQSQGVVLGDMSSLTIEDMGVIETSSSGSQAVLVNMNATSAEITVAEGGTIDAVGAQAILDEGSTDTTVTVDGTVFGGSSEPVIDLGAGNDTVIVNGTVEGSSADPVIALGEGMDELTINSSTTVTGPGILADLGPGEDMLNLNSGQSFTSSQFAGAETVNVGENSLEGDPNMGMATNYTVDDAQSGQTVNNEGGTVDVAEGGTVGTVNSSGGGSTNVNSGGSAETANSSGSGSSTNVEMGGSVENANSSGGSVTNANADMGGTTNVNSGGSVENASSTNGGTTNVQSGGTATNSSAGSGGTLNVASGGDAGTVRSDAGGTVNVRSGGTATVDASSGNGGAINFEAGSNANVASTGSARETTTRIAGANFQEGSLIRSDSLFLESVGLGDTLTTRVRDGAFEQVSRDLGVATVNALEAARAFDGIARAQADGAALDALGPIVQATAEELPALLSRVTNEGSVQAAAGAVQAAQLFTDSLRAGVNPLSGAGAAPVRLAGQPTGYRPYDEGEFGVWGAVSYGKVEVDREGFFDLDAESTGFAGGVEGRIDLAGFDEVAVGAGVGYTYTDVNSLAIDDGDIDSWSGGLYAGGTRGSVRADAALAYTRSDIDNGLDNTDADIVTGRVELSADVFGDANWGANLSALARAEGTFASFDDFEASGPTETVLQNGDVDQGVFGVGVRVGLVDGQFGDTVRASAETAYERVVGDRDLAFAGQVGGTADAFDVIQTVADKNRLHAGANIGIEISDTFDLGLRYDGRFGSDVTDHRASARATLRF